jgi:hypothetical protein
MPTDRVPEREALRLRRTGAERACDPESERQARRATAEPRMVAHQLISLCLVLRPTKVGI